MTTANHIFNADIMEYGFRHRRYWKASSLPVRERIKNKPKTRKYPRDRVLKRIMQTEIKMALNGLIKAVNHKAKPIIFAGGRIHNETELSIQSVKYLRRRSPQILLLFRCV